MWYERGVFTVTVLLLVLSWFDSAVNAFVLLAPHHTTTNMSPHSKKRTGGVTSLTPSQVIRQQQQLGNLVPRKSQNANQVDESTSNANAMFLVPSQVIHSRAPTNLQLAANSQLGASTATAAADASVENDAGIDKGEQEAIDPNHVTKPSRRSRRRLRPKKKRQSRNDDNDDDDNKTFATTTGNLPDPWFRAVSLPHLRCHPQFRPLPPRITTPLQRLDEVSHYRQESWQWDALHQGRCTTSQAAGALGFLNPSVASVLGIPNSWRKGGIGSYQRLSKPALRTVEDMNQAFFPQGENDASSTDASEPNVGDEEPIWDETIQNDSDEDDSAHSKFVADYLYQPNTAEYRRRKSYIRDRSGGEYLDNGIRLLWGNTQEATALLTALNYFAKHVDPQVVVEESGMVGAGLDLNQTSVDRGLLIGATPDGVIRYSDGSMEALEVKNHCPFFSNKGRKRRAGQIKRFSIGDRLIPDGGVLPQYVSQLQMEMLCLGDKCQSAVMVRQTATQGAVILRMKRDDAWIGEMIHFLTRFQEEYVQTQIAPPQDFFWNNMKGNQLIQNANDEDAEEIEARQKEQSRYRRFVNKTAEMANSVQVVATIPNEDIQRINGNAPFFLDGR